MSDNPFTADPSVKERLDAITKDRGEAIHIAIETILNGRTRIVADNLGGVITADEAKSLCEWFALEGIEQLMLLVLPHAQKLARPQISAFEVGAVGLERDTGAIIVGGNIEFPGTHLGLTLNGEGFVATRAFSRGHALAMIALEEAHPCGHCRQYLSEFATSSALVLIDPLGHRLTLGDLYPWPFDPAYLGESGAVPGKEYWPDLQLEPNTIPPNVAAKLEWAGRRAYAPYSKCPSAVVLGLQDGGLIAGVTIESVAYNPTIGPMQAALVDLVAHGYEYADIAEAALAAPRGGFVDFTASTAELLGRIAPDVRLQTAAWAR
jgi:cytidine deaminase